MSTLIIFYGRSSLILDLCIALRNALYNNYNLLVTKLCVRDTPAYAPHVAAKCTMLIIVTCSYTTVHNFVLRFYTKDFLLCYQQTTLGETAGLIMDSSCTLPLAWGLFVKVVIFSKTCIQYTYVIPWFVTGILRVGITFMYLVRKMV